MENYPESLNSLIDDLAQFPGIGRKTAQRMAFYLLNSHSDHATRLANSLINMKEKEVKKKKFSSFQTIKKIEKPFWKKMKAYLKHNTKTGEYCLD